MSDSIMEDVIDESHTTIDPVEQTLPLTPAAISPSEISDNVGFFDHELLPYDQVMQRWVGIRSHLPGMPPHTSSIQDNPQASSHGWLFRGSQPCSACGEHLRNCDCGHCEACGELTTRCQCTSCEKCHQSRDGNCQCKICHSCAGSYNESLQILCDCSCRQCPKPIYGLGCCINMDEEKQAREERLEQLDRRRERHAVRQQKLAILRPMYDWAEANYASYQSSLLQKPANRSLGNVSGRYKFIYNRNEHWAARGAISELNIYQNETRIWGSFRYSKEIWGWFKSDAIPTQASTAAVPCEVATKNVKGGQDDMLTHQPAAPEEPGVDSSDGITFLGNELIKFSPKFLGPLYSATYEFVIFGVRTQDISEGDEGYGSYQKFQQLWQQVHNETNCRGLCRENMDFMEEESGRRTPALEPALSDSPPWDEAAVDFWVSKLQEEKSQKQAWDMNCSSAHIQS